MIIQNLKIQNFRAIRTFDQPLSELTTFIGPNGTGKSTLLKAIRWFFEGSNEGETYSYVDGDGLCQDESVMVEVTFSNLSADEVSKFGKYVNNNTMKLIRECKAGGVDKLFGEAWTIPALDQIAEKNSVAELRADIKNLKENDRRFSWIEVDNLSKINKKDIKELLERWRSDDRLSDHLTPKNGEDCSHFFGAVGPSILQKASGFIFVPAAPDLTSEFDSANRESAINRLLGSMVKEVVNESIIQWQEKNSEVLEELANIVERGSSEGLTAHSERVNRHLEQILPTASIKLKAELDEWAPKVSPIAKPLLQIGQRIDEIANQGHGVQRAALLAILQAVAESRNADSGSPNGNTSSLIICIEEPEVYQHPVQARMLATSFQNAASSSSMQFIIATHSPFFVSPLHLDSTYRISHGSDGARIHAARETKRMMTNNDNNKLEKWFTRTLIEGLFSKGVLLLEGDTDQAVFMNIDVPDLNDRTLGDYGITVANCEGAGNLLNIAAIFQSYGVPVYILRDGDANTALARSKAEQIRDPTEANIEAKVRQTTGSWKSAVEKFIQGLSEIEFEDEATDFSWKHELQIGTNVSILADDLEGILGKWPSFMEQIAPEGEEYDLRAHKHAGTITKAIQNSASADRPIELVKILQSIDQALIQD